MRERKLSRYTAYFRGWCQAFGEHESIQVDQSERYWLFAEKQVGMVLPKHMIKPLYREVLLHEEIPPLICSRKDVQVGSFHFPFPQEHEKQTLSAIEQLLRDAPELHMFLTSHLLYGGGNRIITFSSKRPISIIYKEIGTMKLKLR